MDVRSLWLKYGSLFVSLLLNVEVPDLVGVLVAGHDIEELPERMLLEVLLGEVLQVSLGEGDAGADGDSLGVPSDSHVGAQMPCLVVDFDLLPEEVGEGVGAEDLVLHWLAAVDSELEVDLLLPVALTLHSFHGPKYYIIPTNKLEFI